MLASLQVARCCLPRFQGQPQHLKYQNRIKKKKCHQRVPRCCMQCSEQRNKLEHHLDQRMIPQPLPCLQISLPPLVTLLTFHLQTPKVDRFMPLPREPLCQFASKAIDSLPGVYKFGTVTDRWTDRQRDEWQTLHL